ncbi:MAG: hypothetical protein K2I93_02795 [Oscillospiraceae bacterium]|nr:hypothetical protein [Oscillospiraceae bacterium]
MYLTADLDPILALLLGMFSDFRELAISFKISALGFEFTLWHFWIAILVISIIVPLLFKLSVSSPFTTMFYDATSAGSERLRRIREEEDI